MASPQSAAIGVDTQDSIAKNHDNNDWEGASMNQVHKMSTAAKEKPLDPDNISMSSRFPNLDRPRSGKLTSR